MLCAEACHFESIGDINQAVLLYRKAFRLSPELTQIDIERLAHQMSTTHIANKAPRTPATENTPRATPRPTFQQAEGDHPIITRPTLPPVVREEHSIPDSYLTNLSPDLIRSIFSHLDAPSLDLAGRVCVCWHILSRDAHLWQRLCEDIWGREVTKSEVQYHGMSYRTMYLRKPHLHFDGLYMNKTSYIRCGLRDWTQTHDPTFICKYFRYLRFFPDGTVHALLTNLEPRTLISMVKQDISGMEEVRLGRYSLDNEFVRVQVPNATGRTMFHYHLRIAKTNVNVRQCLKWVALASVTGSQVPVPMSSSDEGPFYFARVV
eukprot:c5433_g1_i2.p1 GENE.c5433_g1_i2~~c5433_g1_i2.p1  ORF type:complete len:319 (-),score=51.95 c5433_g1_i2:16-972(-)